MKREISSSANGRVNLLGEHLDYNGGAVLPLQIDKCVKIYLSDNNTNEKIVIKSKQYDEKIIGVTVNKQDLLNILPEAKTVISSSNS